VNAISPTLSFAHLLKGDAHALEDTAILAAEQILDRLAGEELQTSNLAENIAREHGKSLSVWVQNLFVHDQAVGVKEDRQMDTFLTGFPNQHGVDIRNVVVGRFVAHHSHYCRTGHANLYCLESHFGGPEAWGKCGRHDGDCG
jgi:hypothetical protein